MKRIKDKETKAKFDQVLKELPHIDVLDLQSNFEHFFMAGRESVCKEITNREAIAAQQPKRTIAHLTELGGHIWVISNDGKLFRNHYATPNEWQTLPDLPQD